MPNPFILNLATINRRIKPVGLGRNINQPFNSFEPTLNKVFKAKMKPTLSASLARAFFFNEPIKSSDQKKDLPIADNFRQGQTIFPSTLNKTTHWKVSNCKLAEPNNDQRPLMSVLQNGVDSNAEPTYSAKISFNVIEEKSDESKIIDLNHKSIEISLPYIDKATGEQRELKINADIQTDGTVEFDVRGNTLKLLYHKLAKSEGLQYQIVSNFDAWTSPAINHDDDFCNQNRDKQFVFKVSNVYSVSGRGTFVEGDIKAGILNTLEPVIVAGQKTIVTHIQNAKTGVKQSNKKALLLRGIKHESVKPGDWVVAQSKVSKRDHIWHLTNQEYITEGVLSVPCNQFSQHFRILSNNKEIRFGCESPWKNATSLDSLYKLVPNNKLMFNQQLKHFRIYESTTQVATFVVVPPNYLLTQVGQEKLSLSMRSHLSAIDNSQNNVHFNAIISPNISDYEWILLRRALSSYWESLTSEASNVTILTPTDVDPQPELLWTNPLTDVDSLVSANGNIAFSITTKSLNFAFAFSQLIKEDGVLFNLKYDFDGLAIFVESNISVNDFILKPLKSSIENSQFNTKNISDYEININNIAKLDSGLLSTLTLEELKVALKPGQQFSHKLSSDHDAVELHYSVIEPSATISEQRFEVDMMSTVLVFNTSGLRVKPNELAISNLSIEVRTEWQQVKTIHCKPKLEPNSFEDVTIGITFPLDAYLVRERRVVEYRLIKLSDNNQREVGEWQQHNFSNGVTIFAHN